MSGAQNAKIANQYGRQNAESPQGTSKSSGRDWPAGMPWHSRILSSWSDPHLCLDLSPRSETRTINLASIPLPGNRSVGGPFAVGLSLEKFPHWMDTARAYSVLSLHDVNSSHAPVAGMVNALNHVCRLFGWCVLQRVYHLSLLTQRDMADLAESLRPKGWFSALGIEKRLEELVDRAAQDPELLAKLIRPSPTQKSRGHVRVEAVSNEIGVPITSREMPFEFRNRLGTLAGLWVSTIASQPRGDWSESSFKNVFVALNRLARCPETLDRLAFEPFPNTREYARKQGGRSDGRTPNLPVEDAGKLMSVALHWIYRRGPGLVELVKIWREAVHEASQRFVTRTSVGKFVKARVCEAYLKIREQYDLPADVLIAIQKSSDKDGATLVDMIKCLETAVFIVVGVNQARRKNELLGERRRPWGLYYGCVQSTDPFVDAYELDIYIEKTLRDWASMSCNKLVVDSIAILERLREAIYPEEAAAPVGSKDEARTRKLFGLPANEVLLNPKLETEQYSFRDHSAGFFEEAGLGQQYWRTHIFRRLFALLYYYRFDHPSLQALSEALFHIDLECTRVYVTDPDMRAEAERIEAVYQTRSVDPLDAELAEVQRAYADDLVHAMLTSNGAGGPMTRRVQKMARRLARGISFDEQDLTVVEGEIREILKRRGYAPTPDLHGACWAADNRLARRAHCAKDGQLHREKACIKTCRRCPNHSTSLAFLTNIEREVEHLVAQAKGSQDPMYAEAAYAEAESLQELINLELKLMDRYSEQAQSGSDKEPKP